MNTFPVLKSLLSPTALASVVADAYGLVGVRCQLLAASMRDVYRVESDMGRNILFVYHSGQRTADEIRAEWEFIASLDAAGVLVAPAVLQRDGELLLTIDAPEGIRHGVLSTYVEGEMFRRRPSPQAARAYGRGIAQVHVQADRLTHPFNRPPLHFASIVERPVAAFASVYSEQPDAAALLMEAMEFLRPRISALPTEAPEYGIIHGDAIRANAQVSASGAVTILDFDLCGPGWRAYDVATFLQVIEGTPTQGKIGWAFLDGYQAVRPLSKRERHSLRLFIAAHAIFNLCVPALDADTKGSTALSEAAIVGAIEGIRQKLEKIN